MREVAGDTPFKVTFPAASIFAHPFTTVEGAYGSRRRSSSTPRSRSSADSSPTPIAAGARYIQFDFPLYPYLVDPAWIERFEAAGHDVAAFVEPRVAADAAVLEGIPDDVTVGLHICRGNFRSSWMCEGSLEPVAERRLRRAGLRHVPRRVGRRGTRRRLRACSAPARRLDDGHGSDQLEDARSRGRGRPSSPHGGSRSDYAGGMDRLAISPQCGFASVMLGNETNEDAQWRKLELVGRIADRSGAEVASGAERASSGLRRRRRRRRRSR